MESLSFHALFDAAADAMLLADDAGRVVLANPAAQELFGYPEEEFSGLTVEILMPARYRADHCRHRDVFSSRLEARPMGNGRNLVALDRDGRELPVDISLSSLATHGRSYTLITLCSAAWRRQTEEALQASEERLRLAQRAAGLGIFDRDLIRGTLHWDERSRELWGLDPDEGVTYEKFLAGVHPEDRAARQAALERAIDPAGSGEYKAEFRVVSRRDGSVRWITTTGQVFFEAGQAVRLVGVMQDITAHKIMERKFREHRVEMESLLKQQVAAQTASAIAHELNQPLAAVSAYSEVALRELGSNNTNPGQLIRALSGCVEQAQRAGQTLHELLDFLQKGELASESMDISSLVQEALAIAGNDGFGGFRPVLELERGLPPILGNRIQVQKVLANLLRNGVEAMREAGVPTSAITVKVRALAGRNMAQITVRDSGPGIDADTAQRIFEPFFTTKSRGIGMGLAISRALVEANGGQLWADPDAGPGAAFHFTLPFAA